MNATQLSAGVLPSDKVSAKINSRPVRRRAFRHRHRCTPRHKRLPGYPANPTRADLPPGLSRDPFKKVPNNS